MQLSKHFIHAFLLICFCLFQQNLFYCTLFTLQFKSLMDIDTRLMQRLKFSYDCHNILSHVFSKQKQNIVWDEALEHSHNSKPPHVHSSPSLDTCEQLSASQEVNIIEKKKIKSKSSEKSNYCENKMWRKNVTKTWKETKKKRANKLHKLCNDVKMERSPRGRTRRKLNKI